MPSDRFFQKLPNHTGCIEDVFDHIVRFGGFFQFQILFLGQSGADLDGGGKACLLGSDDIP